MFLSGVGSAAHLGTIQADDAVDIARAVVEVGDGDSVLAGGQPVLLGVGVDLEDVGPRAVDGLLPEGEEEEVVNLFVPQHQRLAEPTASGATPIASRGARSPWQPNHQLAILHSYATERQAVKPRLPALIALYCTQEKQAD